MTKLAAPTAKKLTALGFTAKSEEEAKTMVNNFLIKQGIEGMEDEELETLIDLAESFVEEADTTEVGTETEEDLDKLSEEEEVPVKKAAAKKAAVKKVTVKKAAAKKVAKAKS